MAGWGGELLYPRFQTSITDGGHGNRLIGALETLKERLEPIHKRLRTVIIERLPWQECIDRYDRSGTVMYLDPPYPENGCNYAHNMRDWADHQALAERLATTNCKWMLSSYDIPKIREMFAPYTILRIESYSGMKAEKHGSTRVLNEEVLIANFDPPSQQAADARQPHQPQKAKAAKQTNKMTTDLWSTEAEGH